jgi:hypothetical protein
MRVSRRQGKEGSGVHRNRFNRCARSTDSAPRLDLLSSVEKSGNPRPSRLNLLLNLAGDRKCAAPHLSRLWHHRYHRLRRLCGPKGETTGIGRTLDRNGSFPHAAHPSRACSERLRDRAFRGGARNAWIERPARRGQGSLARRHPLARGCDASGPPGGGGRSQGSDFESKRRRARPRRRRPLDSSGQLVPARQAASRSASSSRITARRPRASASSWRTRSRVRSRRLPIASSESGGSPSSP